jgi:hypothetical protein
MTGRSPSRGASSGTAVGPSSTGASAIGPSSSTGISWTGGSPTAGSPTARVRRRGVGSVNSSCGTAGVWSALSG